MLLHHEINNIDIKYFLLFHKLYAISSRTKSIQQGLYFPWFLKRTTTKTEFFVTSSSDLLLIF
jgi:hypothetical protein